MADPPVHLFARASDPGGLSPRAAAGPVPARRRHDVARAQLARETTPDVLLGLSGRQLIEEAIDLALEHLRVRGEPSAVLFIDLDGLRAANEDLRVALAKRLAAALRPDDVVASFRDDVFVVVARGVADDDLAYALATRLTRELEAPLDGVGGPQIRASVGISLMREQDPSAAAVVARADAAMFSARNKAFRDAHGDDDQPSRLSREAQVEAAFERSTIDDLAVCYQPIADLRDGSIAAVQAHVHWEHPELGTIAAHEWEPIADAHGQLPPIGRWALDEACAQTVRWAPARSGRPMRTCVAAAPAQVADASFADDVMRALDRGAATGHALALSFTAAALAAASPGLLEELADAGVELIFDNADARCAAQANLGLLPIGMLTLDLATIDARSSSDVTRTLAETAATAGRLGARAVATGVERHEQLQMVIDAGFSFAQGSLFKRSQSAPATEHLVYAERPFAGLIARRPASLDVPAHDGEAAVEVAAPSERDAR